MTRPTRLTAALKEWRALEKQCSESARDGMAFLTGNDGELLLLGGRPVVGFVFGRAWAARREVERLAAEAGIELPPVGISSAYSDWPSIDALAQYFLMVTGDMQWSEMKADYLNWFGGQPPQTVFPIGA